MIGLLFELPPTSGRDLEAEFRSGFGIRPPIEEGNVVGPAVNGLVRAGARLSGSRCDLFSSAMQHFWHARQKRYLAPSETITLLDSSEFANRLDEGDLLPAIDAPILVVDRPTGGLSLFSSCSGAGVFYYVIRGGLLYAADHMSLMNVAREDAVDPLAVAEILRFGANYCERSMISSIQRIPFGHVLKISGRTSVSSHSYVDFSWRPQTVTCRRRLKEELKAAVSDNIALARSGGTELLFSSGVDSSILGAVGSASGRVTRGWFMSLNPEDDQQAFAVNGANTAGLKLNVLSFKRSWDQLEEALAEYSEPTLDFSVLPTYQLVRSIFDRTAAIDLLDGTGGDAWLGFGSLSHAGIWRKLRVPAKLFGRPAGYLFSRCIGHSASWWTYPMMVLARVSANGDPALSHMCANSAWRHMVRISRREWSKIERDICETLTATGPGTQTDIGRVILSDATMIAVAQFAAKSSKHTAMSDNRTIYPFLMPNIVEIGRRLPADMMVCDGIAKPLLKEIACELGFTKEYTYRRKRGFQPPLQQLLQNPDNRSRIDYWICKHEDELSPILSPFLKRLPEVLLDGNNRTLNLKSLYSLWGVLAVRIWLHHFRGRGSTS